jgi:hypothetical protein
MLKELLLNDPERMVLDEALELYIHLSLGNVEKINKRLQQLNPNISVVVLGDAVQIEDSGSKTICAFAIQSKLGDNHGGWEWASKKLHELRSVDPLE